MSIPKASSSDFSTVLEEQLKATEGRNKAMQSYLNALEEEERELKRLKVEMMTGTRTTHTNSSTNAVALSASKSNTTTVINRSNNHSNDNDNKNDNPITIPFTNQNNNYSNNNNNRLVLGGGIFVSMVGLRQFLQQRPVKQKELNDHDENLMTPTTTKKKTTMMIPPNTYKVIGIGTGGCNVVQRVYSKTKEHYLSYYEFVQIKEAEASNKNDVIKTGSKNTLQTLLIGTQSDVNSSKREQIQYGVYTSKQQLTVLLEDAKCIVCALEASDLFTSIVSSVMTQQETNKAKKGLSICIASTAFPFEGDKRIRRSKKTIDNLTQIADMTVVVPSTVILDTVSKDTPIKTVYSMVDEILSLGVTGILHLTDDETKDSSKRLLGSTNLNQLKKRFQNSNSLGSMGIGKGEGSNAAVDAVLSAIASPMLGEINIQVKSILCTIQGGPNSMTSKDVRACEETLLQCFGQATEVFSSAFIDETCTKDVVSVVIIALDH